MLSILKYTLLGKNSLILLALMAIFVSILLKPVSRTKAVYNFQVTFDISQSMNVKDVFAANTPVSRLSMAKQAALELLNKLPCGSQIGWSIFTERRVVALITPTEVCEHYAGLRSSLNFISPNMRWAEASGVGKALYQSIRAADAMELKPSIVFMTDGHEAPPLRRGSRGMPATDKFNSSGIIIGVGGTTPVRIPKQDSDGQFIGYWQAEDVVQQAKDMPGTSHEELSSRQDRHLTHLSRLSKLHYQAITVPSKLPLTVLKDTYAVHKPTPVDLRWIPASIALLLLCWRFMPGNLTFIRR